MFQDIMEELVPEGEGDGQFNLGEVLLFAFTVVLATFTAFRSYDFIKHTLPPGWELVAYVGLAVLDGGFLVWALVIAVSATSAVQIAIAWSMWLLDALGVSLVTIADTFFYIQPADQTVAMAQTVSAIAAWAFPILAVVNAAMAILYKIMSPHRIRERRRRQKMNALRQLAEMGELQAQLEQLQAALASKIVDRRMSLADMKAALTQRMADLERLEEELNLERIRRAQLTLQRNEGRDASAAPVPQGEEAMVASNGNHHHSDFTISNSNDYTGLDVGDMEVGEGA